METQYPYLIVRLMPAVYNRCPIIFKNNDGEEDKFTGSKALRILNSCPYGKRGRLTKKARMEIIAATLNEVKMTRFRMCVVFSKYSCVYCEPDGSTEKSNGCPSGGVVLS